MKNKITASVVFLMFLLVIEDVNARQWEMNQHITCEAFKLREMSTSGRLTAVNSFIGNFVISSSSNLFFQKLKYQNSNYPINHVNNYFLQDKNDLPFKTKRPLKISKVCKQFIGGELFGIFLGICGTGISNALIPDPGDDPSDGPSFEGIEYRISAFYLGYAIGNALGVYIAGNDKYEEGSYLATLGGSIVSGLIGVSTLIILDNKDIGAYLSILGPPMGSIIGFNLSRKPRESAGNAFINYDRDQLKLSLGDINVHCDSYYKPLLNVNLFQANF
ncbi:MAG TPA: hypothetical protein DHW42_04395 [Candidatus Marinimicrobia bacterium]|nr:hypothetical protein [Candidatus Neomarinimicrobiota bacterium]